MTLEGSKRENLYKFVESFTTARKTSENSLKIFISAISDVEDNINQAAA